MFAKGRQKHERQPLQSEDKQEAQGSQEGVERTSKYPNVTTALAADDEARFTAEEWARLVGLRERLQALTPLDPGAEPDVDVTRLQFARWLVQQGKLGEGDDVQPSRARPLASRIRALARRSQ